MNESTRKRGYSTLTVRNPRVAAAAGANAHERPSGIDSSQRLELAVRFD